jgi:DNA-binding transcriptional LysR family regulator
MKLDQIRYIIEIARCGSFNKAAEKLFVSQSNLSASIKSLEEELGISIFMRTNKGIKLTPVGQELVRHSNNILQQINYIEDLCNIPKDNLPISFKVVSQHFSFIIEKFLLIQQKYSSKDFNFTFKETNLMDVIENVSNHEFEKGLEFHDISKEDLYIYIGPNSPLYNRESVDLRDLNEYPYVSYPEEANDYHYELKQLGAYYNSKKINVYDRGSFHDTLLKTDAYGIGFHFNRIYNTNKSYGPVKAFHIDSSEIYVRLGWIKHKQTVLSPIGNEFINIVKHDFESPILL